ncbi:putative ribonuclease H-like domain-containing protein [Tanacetum coccineum]
MAISSSSSSSSSDKEVQNCSKQCLESFKTLQKNYDSEREKHSRARLEIQGYELALESLESRILGHEKNELAWGEKYEFQNYELKCRELKINNLNMELEKVVKERDELNIRIVKWEESSKSLNILLNSQMSAHDKNGLGYGTQMDEISNKSETDSEISMSVFEVRSSDEELTPANDRFSKADGYHVVPPPITGNFLTPRADISFAGLDEYAIRKKIIESKTDTSKSKTSETVGKTNEVNIEKPKSVNESVVSTPNINKDKVIIEDWNSDDENDVSEVSPVKTNETQTAKTQVDKIGQTSKKAGIGFKKIKACFVCKSTDHLIKDCDFYDKKSPEPKLKNVVNTGQRVVKPVWDNAKRVNHQKISNKLKYPQAKRTFVPSGVLTRTGLVNPVRTNGKRAVHTVSTARPISTARPFAPKLAQTGSAIRPIYPRIDNVRPRASYSPIKRSYYTKPAFRPKKLKQDVKTSRVKNMTIAGTKAVVNTGKGKMNNDLKKSRWVWRPKGNYMDHESKEKGSFILKKFEYVDPKGISKSVIMKITIEASWLLEVIPEEVYVQQPPGFVDLAYPNKVYKVIKALYDLHQEHRAWYETLSSFLLENGFRRGTIDKTLFIKKNKSDIMLVQVYVDDIIFGSTTQSMCTEFEDCMHKRFQMSSMADILKKFDFCSIKTTTTPIESNKPLVKDEDGVDVYVHIYRSMIGSLMYLTASRPDIMFDVCACARFQVTPKALHLNAVKQIFRYLKHQTKLGLWYLRDSPFELEAFSNSDYGGASLDRKSTTGGCQFLGRRLISWQCKKQTIMANSTTKVEYVAAAISCGQPLSLSFDFVFSSEIFKSLSFRLDRLCHLAILCLDQHAHTLHHLESLLTISLDRLDIFEGRSCISEFVRKSLSLILKLS